MVISVRYELNLFSYKLICSLAGNEWFTEPLQWRQSSWRFGGEWGAQLQAVYQLLLLHTHTHTHTRTNTHWHISFQKSCQCCLSLTTKALVWSLSIQCEIIDGQGGIWRIFFEHLGFLLLMLHTILHLNMTYSSNWEIRTVPRRGGPDYLGIHITEG